MKKLLILITVLTIVSCSKEETDNQANGNCSCTELIYEHDFRTTVNGTEANFGELLDVKENLLCQTSRNEARENNDYPESEFDLLWVVVDCE